MMPVPRGDAGDGILTLEPFLEAVQSGIEGVGWSLSGLQKTTSFRFEGRWEGDSTRSAYLFFHREGLPDHVSVDVYLDETSRGLKGNLALVMDGPPAGNVPSVVDFLASLSPAASKHLAGALRRPLTIRFRMGDVDREPGDATAEVRFKAHIPDEAITGGGGAIADAVGSIARSFENLLLEEEIRRVGGWGGDGTD